MVAAGFILLRRLARDCAITAGPGAQVDQLAALAAEGSPGKIVIKAAEYAT